MYLTDASRFLMSCVIQHYAPVVVWGGEWRNRCIMLIMTLDPSWRQTLSLPPTGIEPGSPASQVGTLPKELSREHIPVLRIWDVYPKSRIPDPTFFHPGSQIRPVSIPDPGSRIRIKEFKYFNTKKTKKMVSKL